jgi:metal-dependent amidase/aminoacylase/carboxypeptidase family protein
MSAVIVTVTSNRGGPKSVTIAVTVSGTCRRCTTTTRESVATKVRDNAHGQISMTTGCRKCRKPVTLTCLYDTRQY